MSEQLVSLAPRIITDESLPISARLLYVNMKMFGPFRRHCAYCQPSDTITAIAHRSGLSRKTTRKGLLLLCRLGLLTKERKGWRLT